MLVGANGCGKTSVLEALSLLAPGRGLRRARLPEMVRADEGAAAIAWSIAARLVNRSGPIDLLTSFAADANAARDRRQVKIDGQPARGRAALAEALAVIWLTPDMDRLFTDGPAARRRFLDRVVWGIDPAHSARVAAYERAMYQRSVLLRRSTVELSADPSWLDALEETMARLGVAVAAARRQTATQLSQILSTMNDGFPPASVTMRGSLEDWLDAVPALTVEDRFRVALASARRGDSESGGAAYGPHRSDMRVLHTGSQRPAETCSTGEQKMLLVGLVLAGARLQQRERREAPLLLLDDVVAHLDARHRYAVFAAVDALAAQVWYTGTDLTPFLPLGDRAQIVRIEQANDGHDVEPENELGNGASGDGRSFEAEWLR